MDLRLWGTLASAAAQTGESEDATSRWIIERIDNDVRAISSISGLQPKRRNLIPLMIDLSTDACWPFGPAELGAILCVHYFRIVLLNKMISSLKTGGYLLIETISNRGGNYLALSKQGTR
jgi:hypothetical protein